MIHKGTNYSLKVRDENFCNRLTFGTLPKDLLL